MRAILFDLGDTLFRLEPMNDAALRRHIAGTIRGRIGVDEAESASLAANVYDAVVAALRESYRSAVTAEPRIARLAAASFAKYGAAEAEHLSEEVDRIFGEADTSRWVQTPERELHLARFADAGLHLAFVSNTLTAPELMCARLTEFGLLDHAKVHVFSVAVGERKPSPAIYRAALDGLGIGPGDAVFVGDRVREDVLGPQALGMRGVLTHEFRQEEPGEARPHGIIRAVPELWDLLD